MACHISIYMWLIYGISFLSLAGKGRLILVAPGFCPAVGVHCPASRFLVGAKTQKLHVNFF